jgi:hypothetical protein
MGLLCDERFINVCFVLLVIGLEKEKSISWQQLELFHSHTVDGASGSINLKYLIHRERVDQVE